MIEQGEKNPAPHEIEAYKQAHETRRKWEGYIWQYGMIVLALIGFLAGRLSTGNNNSHFTKAGIIEKCVLTLLTLFLGSTFLNVYRARILMKQLEKSIYEMHKKWGLSQAIIPFELDRLLTKNRHKFSSTRLAILSHLLLFIAVFIATLFFWIY